MFKNDYAYLPLPVIAYSVEVSISFFFSIEIYSMIILKYISDIIAKRVKQQMVNFLSKNTGSI